MKINLNIENKSSVATLNGKSTETLSKKEKEKLKTAAYDFQSIMINQMLKSMRDTQLKDENSEDSYGGEIFSELFDMQLAQNLSKNSHFGIAESIYKQLTGDELSSLSKPSKNEKSEKNLNFDEKIDENTKKQKTHNSGDIEKKLDKFDDIINSAAKKFGIDSNLIKAVIAAESGGNVTAISKANAKGLMQLIDKTAKDLGVKNSFNPFQNIQGGTKYLSDLLEKYNGELDLALAAYNAGPGAVDKYSGIPPFKETIKYIDTVKTYYKSFEEK